MLTFVRADRRARESGSRYRLRIGTAEIVRKALELSGCSISSSTI
jgi:hypothetical protein